MQMLKETNADLFLMTYDPPIMNSERFRYFVDCSITHPLPLVVPSKALLRGGAVLSLEASYLEIGRQTGQLVNGILSRATAKSGEFLDSPRKTEIGVNLKVADIMGVTIAPQVLQKAHYVHE